MSVAELVQTGAKLLRTPAPAPFKAAVTEVASTTGKGVNELGYNPFVAGAGPLDLSRFNQVYGDSFGAPPRLTPGKSTLTPPRQNPFSETAARIQENYNRELPGVVEESLLLRDVRDNVSQMQGSLYDMHEAVLSPPYYKNLDKDSAQNIAQLISSRIGNRSNAPMGELKTLSTAERLADEKAINAVSFSDMIEYTNKANDATLKRQELLRSADVDNVNINSQMSPINNNFDASLRELKASELVGMEDIAGVTSQKRFGELTKGIDRIEGYDEVAHNATNANVVEEVAGVTNPSKDLFGVYDPTRDPAKVGGIFGTMAGTSGSGILGSIGVGAGVGAIGSYMTGGDATEGMVAGGVAGLGLRGISGAINANAMGIQRGMYKSILGEGAGNMTNAEMKQALRDVNKDNLNIGQRGVYSVLANPNKSSVGFNLRNQTLAGGFLAGATFSSRRSDKRRGFNAHRGNRI